MVLINDNVSIKEKKMLLNYYLIFNKIFQIILINIYTIKLVISRFYLIIIFFLPISIIYKNLFINQNSLSSHNYYNQKLNYFLHEFYLKVLLIYHNSVFLQILNF